MHKFIYVTISAIMCVMSLTGCDKKKAKDTKIQDVKISDIFESGQNRIITIKADFLGDVVYTIKQKNNNTFIEYTNNQLAIKDNEVYFNGIKKEDSLINVTELKSSNILKSFETAFEKNFTYSPYKCIFNVSKENIKDTINTLREFVDENGEVISKILLASTDIDIIGTNMYFNTQSAEDILNIIKTQLSKIDITNIEKIFGDLVFNVECESTENGYFIELKMLNADKTLFNFTVDIDNKSDFDMELQISEKDTSSIDESPEESSTQNDLFVITQ